MMADKATARLPTTPRHLDRLLRRVMQSDSIENSPWRDVAPCIKCPICHAFSLAECGQEPSSRSVPLIQRWSDPTAILSFVRAIIVDTVYFSIVSVARCARPCAERDEHAPFHADVNSALAIMFIALVIGVCAALNHAIPAAIQACSLAATILTMNRLVLERAALFASAGFGIGEQFEGPYEAFRAALAPARIRHDIVRSATNSAFVSDEWTDHGPQPESICSTYRRRFHAVIISEDENGNCHCVF